MVEIYGTDCNAMSIRWCQTYLPFAKFSLNSLQPPLQYPDRMFDLIYAFSVFTHLTEPLQKQWMDELRRVLAPGGYLIITVHGDKYLEHLSRAERVEYQKGNLVVRRHEAVGTNDCSAYHPESYVRRVLAQGLEVTDFILAGAQGNPPQDAYLMRA